MGLIDHLSGWMGPCGGVWNMNGYQGVCHGREPGQRHHVRAVRGTVLMFPESGDLKGRGYEYKFEENAGRV